MRLVPKFKGNIVVIFLCTADGGRLEIARLCMPQDDQLIDTTNCVQEIIKALEKRIGSSI